MTSILDTEITYWNSATDKAVTKELAILSFGISAGLRMAKNKLMEQNNDPILASDGTKDFLPK